MLLDCNSFESYQTNTSNMCSEIHYFTKARNTIGEIINTEICKENKPKVYFQQHMARESRKRQRGGSKRKPTTKKGRREEREKREEERVKEWEKLREERQAEERRIQGERELAEMSEFLHSHFLQNSLGGF